MIIKHGANLQFTISNATILSWENISSVCCETFVSTQSQHPQQCRYWINHIPLYSQQCYRHFKWPNLNQWCAVNSLACEVQLWSCPLFLNNFQFIVNCTDMLSFVINKLNIIFTISTLANQFINQRLLLVWVFPN